MFVSGGVCVCVGCVCVRVLVVLHEVAPSYKHVHMNKTVCIPPNAPPYLREARELDVADPVRGGAEEGGELDVGHAHQPPREGQLDAVLPCVCVVLGFVGLFRRWWWWRGGNGR